MRDCSYSTLPDYQPWPEDQPGFFLLEWDIALDRRERELFQEHALARPDRVLVAPYWKLLPDRKTRPGLVPKQIHRSHGRPVRDGTPLCETFGFGCIYFPQKVLNDWLLSDWPGSAGAFNDSTFSAWHFETIGHCAIDWTVHPQHLHGD